VQFKSNIAAVISRTKRLQSHDIPSAMKRALNKDYWSKQAYAEAEAALNGLANNDQKQFVAGFLATLKSMGLDPAGFVLTMNSPFPPEQTVAGLAANRAAVSPLDLAQNLFLSEVQKVEDWLTEWVATEKDKDKRDAGKTDEEIGSFISYAMFAPGGEKLIVGPGTKEKPNPNAGRTVREVFTPHITDFLKRKQAAGRLDAETVDAWLRAVLVAWRNLVRDLFPQKFHTELLAVRGELALAGGQ
jgi:hypothetical protein